MNNYTVTGFGWVPAFAQGLTRDLRVRWALEEAGFPYDVAPIDLSERKSAAFRQKQPFGMIPTVAADVCDLFESGAIVHLIAEKSETLMPLADNEHAETIVWMYAALDTVEPPIWKLATQDLQHGAEEWAKLSRPHVVDEVHDRLEVLAGRVENREFLIGRFTAADILMATTLRLIRHTDLVASYPAVDRYLKRCEARPAFVAALARQMAEFASNEPVAA